MKIDFTADEAREIALVLRHFYDCSTEQTECPDHALAIYISVIAKLQDALGITATPWQVPEVYELRS